MADPRQEYIIDAGSSLSTHKLEVVTDLKGVLTKVTMNQSSAAVAEEFAKQGGNVAKAALDDLKAERTAEETRKNTIASDIQKTRIEIGQSEAKIKFYQGKIQSTTDAEQSKWQSKLDDEQVNLTSLESKLDELTSQRKNLDSSGFNTAGTIDGFQKAWGPMIFRVEQTANQAGVIDQATGNPIPELVPSVRLVAMFDQLAFPTNVMTDATGTGPEFDPKARVNDTISLSGNPTKEIDFNVAVASIDNFALIHAAGNEATGTIEDFKLDPGGQFATLTIKPAAVGAGSYDLIFSGKLVSGQVFVDAPVRLNLIP